MKYSVAITEKVNQKLLDHLIRKDGQEDLCFAFYRPSTGAKRSTAILSGLMLPVSGERVIQGNVSFNSCYLDRAVSYALKHGLGICFLHSHPFKGWQRMSVPDVEAEKYLASVAFNATGLPLVGLTVSQDAVWSARFWPITSKRNYQRKWCESVRIVGKGLKVSFAEHLAPQKTTLPEFTRTISAWGVDKQADLSRLKVGVVGTGSVGFSIPEGLKRMGIRNFVFVDPDKIKRHNLDRLPYVGIEDIGKYKVNVLKKRMQQYSFQKIWIDPYPDGVQDEKAFRALLDCDVIFCCVDRPYPRYILDCMSQANLIPVIDGGVDVRALSDGSNLDYARWKTHTVGPDRRCMQCLGQHTPHLVASELSGALDDPSYIQGLPKDHGINHGENVYAFSMGAASLEILQFLNLALRPWGLYQGPNEYDFGSGALDKDFDEFCEDGCNIRSKLALADEENQYLVPSPAFKRWALGA